MSLVLGPLLLGLALDLNLRVLLFYPLSTLFRLSLSLLALSLLFISFHLVTLQLFIKHAALVRQKVVDYILGLLRHFLSDHKLPLVTLRVPVEQGITASVVELGEL